MSQKEKNRASGVNEPKIGPNDFSTVENPVVLGWAEEIKRNWFERNAYEIGVFVAGVMVGIGIGTAIWLGWL